MIIANIGKFNKNTYIDLRSLFSPYKRTPNRLIDYIIMHLHYFFFGDG